MTDVLIVDDHPLFRDALSAAVLGAAPRAEIRQASSIASALDRIRERRPDLILLDLVMADAAAMGGLIAVRGECPDTPVAVVSATETPQTVRQALELGAVGYIRKSASLDDMMRAISRALRGERDAPPADEAPSSAASVARLTPAQMKVLVGIAKGRLNKQIAYDMSISEATVKAHVTAIFRKLDVVNRTQAVLVAKDLLLGVQDDADADAMVIGS